MAVVISAPASPWQYTCLQCCWPEKHGAVGTSAALHCGHKLCKLCSIFAAVLAARSECDSNGGDRLLPSMPCEGCRPAVARDAGRVLIVAGAVRIVSSRVAEKGDYCALL